MHRYVFDRTDADPSFCNRYAGVKRLSETRIAVIVILLGMLGVAYGGFHYLGVANAAGIALVPASFDDVGILSVWVWLGAGAIFAGVTLLLTRTSDVRLFK